jgi:hypothetical protein
MRTLLLAAALAFAGCAPDPMLGSFDYTMSSSDTETAPGNGTSNGAGAGVLAVTTGKAADYLVTLAHADTTPCTFTANRDDKTGIVGLASGQTCLVVARGTGATATLTSGTVTVDEKGENMTVEVAYSYAGQALFGINFAGNGKRTYVGKRR